MKKILKTFLVILLSIIVVLIVVLIIYREYRISKLNFTGYYKGVARECGFLSSAIPFNCCFESVKEMAEYGYKKSNNNNCPEEGMSLRAACPGSISFCMPPKKPTTSLEECYELKEEKNLFSPVVRSNIPGQEITEKDFNEETKEMDYCIFNYVDIHEEITDKNVCEKIGSDYYKYLCRQRIAFHLKNPSLCTIEFLGKQDNVNGCYNVLSIELKDISLCDKTTTPSTCKSNYNKHSK
jgi:hypothetical protein